MQYVLALIALFIIVKIIVKIFQSGVIPVLISVSVMIYGVFMMITALGFEVLVFTKVGKGFLNKGMIMGNIIILLTLLCLFAAWMYFSLSSIFLGKWIKDCFILEDLSAVFYIILNNVLIKMLTTVVAILVSMKFLNMDIYGNGFSIELILYDRGYFEILYDVCVKICKFLDKLPEVLSYFIVLVTSVFIVVDSRINYVYTKKQFYRIFPFIFIKGILSYWRVIRYRITHKGMTYICQNCNKEYTDFVYKCNCGNEIKKISPKFGFSRSTICFNCGNVIGVEDDLCKKSVFANSTDNLERICPHCKNIANEFDKKIAKQCVVSVLGDGGTEHRRFVQTFIYEFVNKIDNLKSGYRYSIEDIALNDGIAPSAVYASIKSNYESKQFAENTGFEFAMKVYKAYEQEAMMIHVYNLNINDELDNNRNKVVGMKKKQNVYVVYSENFKKTLINTVEIFRHIKDIPMINGKFDINLIIVNISNDAENNTNFEDMVRSEYENEYTMLETGFESVKFETIRENNDVLTLCEPEYIAGIEYLKSRK